MFIIRDPRIGRRITIITATATIAAKTRGRLKPLSRRDIAHRRERDAEVRRVRQIVPFGVGLKSISGVGNLTKSLRSQNRPSESQVLRPSRNSHTACGIETVGLGVGRFFSRYGYVDHGLAVVIHQREFHLVSPRR